MGVGVPTYSAGRLMLLVSLSSPSSQFFFGDHRRPAPRLFFDAATSSMTIGRSMPGRHRHDQRESHRRVCGVDLVPRHRPTGRTPGRASYGLGLGDGVEDRPAHRRSAVMISTATVSIQDHVSGHPSNRRTRSWLGKLIMSVKCRYCEVRDRSWISRRSLTSPSAKRIGGSKEAAQPA